MGKYTYVCPVVESGSILGGPIKSNQNILCVVCTSTTENRLFQRMAP